MNNSVENEDWYSWPLGSMEPPQEPKTQTRFGKLISAILKFIWVVFFRWWLRPLLWALFESALQESRLNRYRSRKYKKVIKEGLLWDTTYYVEK